MAFNDLPKINEKEILSEEMRLKFLLEFDKLLKDFEKKEKYQFKSFELDYLLIEIVKKNHELYLRNAFGNENK